ncbi:MAG: hypothetical protein ACR2PZ_11015 [Pseudomonadales bacterium]
MRELVVHVDGKPFRGSWDTWEDKAWGRMVEVSREAWMVRAPVANQDALRIAERCLAWCVEESLASRR